MSKRPRQKSVPVTSAPELDALTGFVDPGYAGTGRPSKFTEDRVKRVLDIAKLGIDQVTIAAEVGIDPDTLENWILWGKDGRRGFAEFYRDWQQARAKAETRLIARMHTISGNKDNLQAAARATEWLLERVVAPKKYGFLAAVTETQEQMIQRLVDETTAALGPAAAAVVFERLTGRSGTAQTPAAAREGSGPIHRGNA